MAFERHLARAAEAGRRADDVAEMLVHLGSVHLPLDLGVLSVLITTGSAHDDKPVDQLRRAIDGRPEAAK